jgi:Flp pilus assembly protein TadG
MDRRNANRASRHRLRFWSSRRGNIALITAFVMIPLTFALGMSFDFTLSQSRKDQLDGMADVAALGGVTPTEMAQSSTTAKTQATSLFNGQSPNVAGVSSLSVTVTANDVTVGTKVTRTVVVSYTGKSSNVFASLLGMSTLPISGSSTATATTAPNINFYLLLDTSPSMEIAATSAGITAMQNATQQESDEGTPPNGGGCAFGCHQSAPADLTTTNPAYPCATHNDPGNHNASTQNCEFLTQSYQQIQCQTNGNYADGTAFTTSSTFPETGRDNYDLSRCLNVTLRIDLLNTAVQNLMTTAASAETTYNTTYKMALYETDVNQSNSANDLNLYTLQSLTSNLTLAKTQAATITALEMYNNNHLVSGDSNGDMDTYLDADLASMNVTSIMPNPGNGTNNAGDSPQEVLFIVTDGLNDVPNRQYNPIDWNGTNCTAIKNRGIRIAVLYTTYEPVDESWYLGTVVPYLTSNFSGLPPDLPSTTTVGSDPMALAAQQCASPGLYYQVSTNGDISAALQTLFQEAVATARLSQ